MAANSRSDASYIPVTLGESAAAATNEVRVTAGQVSPYVITQSIADIQGNGHAQVSAQIAVPSSSAVAVTAADLLASVGSLQHVVDSSSGNVYSVAPSSTGSHALTSDSSSHGHPPTSVDSNSHVVGNIVTHYHLGLGLDFGTTNDADVHRGQSESDPSNAATHEGSFLYNEQHQLVDDGNGHMTSSEEHLGSAEVSNQVKMEVDGTSAAAPVEMNHQKEFDCLVETVSCYKCKMCSCILLSKDGVEQHVKMFHSNSKQQEKVEENSSSSSLQNTVVENSTPDSNKRNDTDLYICSPCKKGFPDIDSFTVHMAYTHHLSAGNIQLEPLVLSNESGEPLPAMHQHGQFLFAPSGSLQSIIMQQQSGKEEGVQIVKSSRGPPKKKKKLKGDNENGDSMEPNLFKKPKKGQVKKSANNNVKSSDSECELMMFDGEGSQASESNKNVKPYGKRKITKDKMGADDVAVVGNKCDLNGCNVRLRSLDNLEYHRKCHTDGCIGFECFECKEKFEYWKTLSAHLWRVHLIDMELYTCDLCDYKSYSYGKLMNIHRRIHSDERPYLCDVCGKGFKTSKQLRNHKVIHLDSAKHRSYRSGECDICHRFFSDKRMLRVHKDTVHNKMRPYLCNYCGYAASCRSTLKMHIRQHTGEKPFACDACDYRTADHNSLRRHKMRHSGEKPYKCPFCEYACIQSSTYKTHLKNKHPGMDDGLMFCCDQCSFRTIKKENFVTHMADHSSHSERMVAVSKAAAETAHNQGTKMQSVRLPLQVVLTTEGQDSQETASVHLISEGHEVHVTDASVFQQQIDGVMTQAQFVFPVLDDMSQEISSQVFNVEAENHEEKFPILASHLKMGPVGSSNQDTETTETHVIESHIEAEQEEGEEQEEEEEEEEGVKEEEIGVDPEDHIPEEALSHAQLTSVPPAEVILKQE